MSSQHYPSTPVGDAVSNLVSFNTKSLQYLPRSLLSLSPLAVLSPIYAAMDTALSLTLISTGMIKPRLLHVATMVLNDRIFHISCLTALYWIICVGPYSGIPSHFWTSGPVRGELPNYWDSAELIRAPIPRNGSGKSTNPPLQKTTRLSGAVDAAKRNGRSGSIIEEFGNGVGGFRKRVCCKVRGKRQWVSMLEL